MNTSGEEINTKGTLGNQTFKRKIKKMKYERHGGIRPKIRHENSNAFSMNDLN